MMEASSGSILLHAAVVVILAMPIPSTLKQRVHISKTIILSESRHSKIGITELTKTHILRK